MTDDQAHLPSEQWVARVSRLTDAPGDDLSGTTTAEERLEMVDILSARMWELTGKPIEVYARGELPVKVIRRA